MKSSYSELNLSSKRNGNGTKMSTSAFELLSRTNSVVNEEKPEEVVKPVVNAKVNRPATFK